MWRLCAFWANENQRNDKRGVIEKHISISQDDGGIDTEDCTIILLLMVQNEIRYVIYTREKASKITLVKKLKVS